VIYLACAALCSAAGFEAGGWLALALVAPFAFHLLFQAIRLDPADSQRALTLFRANREAGLLLLASWAFIAAPI
jgi:4-hydroxybenzoate polyprenyltransferase